MQKYLRTDVSVPRLAEFFLHLKAASRSPPPLASSKSRERTRLQRRGCTEPRRCRDGELAATCATARARAYPSAVHCTLKPFFALP